ncbi:MAG: thioredoxin family protein [Bacteroidales bacterium]
MMRKIILAIVIQLITIELIAQTQIYDPNSNAKSDIENAVKLAQKEHKHVLVQIGGNWCPWCVKLHKYFQSDNDIKEIITNNYILVKVNYSKENKNADILRDLENPQRFGFPVLVILDSNGKRIHTQDSGLLESGNGYDSKKVIGFLKNWTPNSLISTSK